MTYKRIIPSFLLKGKRLAKGTQFKDFVDVGDPVSQAMIYDAQGAEEIIIVDIEASSEGRIIDTHIINEMITKCRLPIGAGGGIKSVEDGRKCFKAGADKIVVNTAAILNPSIIKTLSDEFGAQSVVVSLDVKRNGSGGYDVYTFSGRQKANVNLLEYLSQVIDYGAGEIMLTSIDQEGTLKGFDYDLYKKIKGFIPVPLIASGGTGCYDDMVRLFKETDCDACAIGKMLFLRDYDIVRIKAYLTGRKIPVREA
jgi:cyclase